jgi:membrane protease YdiL (CAAX protease family)
MGLVELGRVKTNIGAARLVVWGVLVTLIGALNFAGREASGRPDRNVLYRYGTAGGTLVQYLVILGIVLVIAHGLDRKVVFGLSRPRSIRAATGWIVAALATVWAVSAALSRVLNAAKDQGLVPDHWEPRHAGAFAANFAVIVIVAPIVEELLFRGFGVTGLAAAFGPVAAIVGVGIAFGVWHGLVIAFPALAIFGAILAALRLRTASVYPPMVAHAIFNGTALIAAVAAGVGK